MHKLGFQVGDKVAFIHDAIKGIIIEVEHDGKYLLKTKEGFEIYARSYELCIDNGISDIEIKNLKTSLNYKQKTATKQKKSEALVQDLHLSAMQSQILRLEHIHALDEQLRMAKTAINICQSMGIKKLILIHGLGSGALKEAVLDLLKKDKRVHTLKAAPNNLYGKGATEVIITDKY